MRLSGQVVAGSGAAVLEAVVDNAADTMGVHRRFSGVADTARRADVDTQRCIVVAVAFRTCVGSNLVEDLAGAD
jgi:hypothetical protein